MLYPSLILQNRFLKKKTQKELFFVANISFSSSDAMPAKENFGSQQLQNF